MPLEYDPGDAIQIDWGEATIYLRGERKTIQVFCGRLCCSCDIFVMACEPLRHDGPYDFGRSDLARRMRDAGMQLGTDRDFWHTPPVDALFLHRKIGGLYLLAARLGARVDIRRLFLPHAAPQGTGSPA